MNWDDLRFVLALARAGSLLRAARALGVDHTTVGRRIDSVEGALGVRLFTRTTTGLVPTAEAEALLPELTRVEDAVHALERGAHAKRDAVEGTVRVTSSETFGVGYLAARLAAFASKHPGLTVELVTGGDILDLGRRDADVAVRFFRSRHESLVVRRAGELAHGLYASREYLRRWPVTKVGELKDHPILTTSPGPNVVEAAWVEQLTHGAKPAFVSNLTIALVEAARASAGIAVLPRYLGDAQRELQRLPMPGEPREPIWVTVHRDLKQTRRVRAVLNFIGEALAADRQLLLGG